MVSQFVDDVINGIRIDVVRVLARFIIIELPRQGIGPYTTRIGRFLFDQIRTDDERLDLLEEADELRLGDEMAGILIVSSDKKRVEVPETTHCVEVLQPCLDTVTIDSI